MTVKYTDDEHEDMLQILGTCNSLVLALIPVLVPVLVLVTILVLVLVLVPVLVPVPYWNWYWYSQLVLVPVPVLELVPALVPVLVLLLVQVPVLDNTWTLMHFNSCSSVCVRQELYTAMELVNVRHSRTVLTAANEGDIIAAVGRVPLSSRGLPQELGLS